jgi:hypothetical protein
MAGGVLTVAPVVPPVLDYAPGVYPNGTNGAFDLAESVTPSVGDVLLVLFASRGTTVTMPAGWTSLASGTAGALDYEIAYLVWTGSDDTTGSVSPYFDAPPPAWSSYNGYFDGMLLHFIPSTGSPVPTVSGLVEVTGSPAEAMPTGTATFNVLGAMRSTDNIDGASGVGLVERPTYAQEVVDVAYWAVGMETDYLTPGIEVGTADFGAVDFDWVKFLVTWT